MVTEYVHVYKPASLLHVSALDRQQKQLPNRLKLRSPTVKKNTYAPPQNQYLGQELNQDLH